MASVGAINLRIPRLRRGSYLPEDPIVRYSRADRAAIAAVSEMATSGASARKAGRAAARMGIVRMSPSQGSRICESLDSVVADLRPRSLSEMDEGWASWRWFTEGSIAQASVSTRPAAPTPAYEGAAEEHARRIIDAVVADNPIGGRPLRMMG